MKQDFFNLRRFARYFWQDIKNALSRYWITLVVLMMAGLMVFLFASPEERWVHYVFFSFSFRKLLFCLLFVVLSLTFTVGYYGRFTKKSTGSIFILSPASAFEKSLSMILVSCIVIPSLFIAGYLLVDEAIVGITRNKFCHKELLSHYYSRQDALYRHIISIDSLSNVLSENYPDYYSLETFNDTIYLRTADSCGRISHGPMFGIYKNDSLIIYGNNEIAPMSFIVDDKDIFLAYSTNIEEPYYQIKLESLMCKEGCDIDLLMLRKPFWKGTIFSDTDSLIEEKFRGYIPDNFLTPKNIDKICLCMLVFLFGALFFKNAKGAKTICSIVLIGVIALLPFVGAKGITSFFQMDDCSDDISYHWSIARNNIATFWDNSPYFFIPLCLILCYLIYRRVKKLTF